MKQTITLAELVNMDACGSALIRFSNVFDKKATILDLLQVLKKEPQGEEWEGWLLGQKVTLTRSLLAHGADVHVWEDSPLYEAAINGRTEVVEVLLAHGAYVHVQLDIFRVATKGGHTKTVNVLKKWIKTHPASAV